MTAPVDRAVEREKFEAQFPVPRDCIWCGNGYSATEYNAWDAHKHHDRWIGWFMRAELSAQTLASKEAELAAREAEIANQALNYVSLFGELQNAMAEIERVRSLTDAQIDDLWIRRDCIEAIQAGDICAQVRCVVRAALTQQPTKD